MKAKALTYLQLMERYQRIITTLEDHLTYRSGRVEKERERKIHYTFYIPIFLATFFIQYFFGVFVFSDNSKFLYTCHPRCFCCISKTIPLHSNVIII